MTNWKPKYVGNWKVVEDIIVIICIAIVVLPFTAVGMLFTWIYGTLHEGLDKA
jgi:hypothetical protein